jgi:GNAT superfamily N-acetyltransferase
VETLVGGQRIDAAMLRADLDGKPQARLLLWRDDDGGLLGHVWLEPAAEGAWYLGMLTVRPDRQDNGLGRRLLEAAEDFVRAQGGERVRMTVINRREELLAWYARCGYSPTGETQPFPYDDERFGLPLRDDLEFVVLQRTL